MHTPTTVTGISQTNDGFGVTVTEGGRSFTIPADLLVRGAGRTPNVDGQNLAAANIAASSRGVTVARHLQSTTNPAVYAAGDVSDTAGSPLTPVAVSEGKVAASNMLKGATTTPDYTGVLSTVFTLPELNRVGVLEDEARAQGFDIIIRDTDASSWYSSYRIGAHTARAKVIINRANDTILGAHLLGRGSTELTNTFALAIKLGLTTRQLKSAPTTYPSVGSDLSSLL